MTDGGTAATVLVPAALVADLDLVGIGESDVLRDKEQAFLLEDDVRGVAPTIDGTYDTPAGLIDDDGLGLGIIGDDVIAFLDGDVVTAGDGRERLTHGDERATAVVVPTMVLAELEAAADLRHGAHPLAVRQGHVHIAGPLVEVTDEGPHLAVGDRDGKFVGIQDDLPEAGADLDVVAACDGRERLAEGDEDAAVVLVPAAVLAPLEFRVAFGGDIRRPDAVLLGRTDIIVPVAVQADDVPARDRLRLRLVAAADLGADLRAEASVTLARPASGFT